MSEGPPADTPDQAIRNYLNAIAWMCMLTGVEMIAHWEHPIPAFVALVIGTGFFYAAFKWDWVKTHISVALVGSLGHVATSAQWWSTLVLVLLIGIIFSPYIEQPKLLYDYLAGTRDSVSIHAARTTEDIAKAADVDHTKTVLSSESINIRQKALTQLNEFIENSVEPLLEDGKSLNTSGYNLSLSQLRERLAKMQQEISECDNEKSKILLRYTGIDEFSEIANWEYFAKVMAPATKNISRDLNNIIRDYKPDINTPQRYLPEFSSTDAYIYSIEGLSNWVNNARGNIGNFRNAYDRGLAPK